MASARARSLLPALALALGAAPAGAATGGTRASHHRAPKKHAPKAAPDPKARAAALNQRRAIASYTAMQQGYFIPSVGLYRGDPYYSAVWPYSQAMAATISVAALPKMHSTYRADLVARLSNLEAYADRTDSAPAGYLAGVAPPLGAGGTRFNDDNEWIGIELLRLYHISHQPALLTAAGQLMTMVYSQWDQASDVACPGGVPWQDLTLNGDRNTISNAPGAELGAQLYLTTGQAQYLQWAQRMYAWVRGCLLQPDGLYADHINASQQVDTTEWTYNQGTMIGAGVMLHDATHDPAYLRQAQATAQAALATFGPTQLAQQPVSFNAIYIRNLLLLGAASGDPRYQSFARWFASDAWFNVRDPVSGLFLADPGGATQLIDQASMVQVYALLAEPTSAYF